MMTTQLKRSALAALAMLAVLPAAAAPSLPPPTQAPPPILPPLGPQVEASLGQTVRLNGVTITPIRVVQDTRSGCEVAPCSPPGTTTCRSSGRLVLLVRIDDGRRRTLRVAEWRDIAVRGSNLRFQARPARPVADSALYRFTFMLGTARR